MIVSSLEERGQKSLIKRVIRHAHSYQGGASYGNYGGYDISLLELETPISGLTLACVPKLGFDDIRQGKLAGYGSYQRNKGLTCQTNKFGKMKYHYCEDPGNGKQVCHQQAAPQNPACRKFFEKNKHKIKDFPEDRDEILILQEITENNKTYRYKPSFCFKTVNQEKSEYGWCQVDESYYNLYSTGEKVKSWGYCSKDCYLDPNEGPNKRRIVDNAEVKIFIFISVYTGCIPKICFVGSF